MLDANLGQLRPWGATLLLALWAGACSETTSSRDATTLADTSPNDAVTERGAGDGALADDSRSSPTDGAAADNRVPPANSLSARYPDDDGIADDPAVLFHDDFEQGWGKWDAPTADTTYLHLETNAALAHAGTRFLRSTVTKAHLDAQRYISASPRVDFPRRVGTVYWRFHARFKGIAPNPHHWVRMSAGDASYWSSGLANTVPPGDEGFWFDFDINNDDVFDFYVYWYKMRSSRCNDGTAVPGCAGDQGVTNYYGNVFRPPSQTPFVRDRWLCIEIMAQANAVGSSDGELAFWIDDQLVDSYRRGHPSGTWLRSTFHTGGCDFSACEAPGPFEGFDFRSSDEVRFKRIFMDAYNQRGSFADKKAALEAKGLTVSDEQTIYYDDVVVATERIGCRASR